MGFEQLFAGLVAAWMIDRYEHRDERKKAALRRRSAAAERMFVNARKKDISAAYVPFTFNSAANTDDAHETNALHSLPEHEREQVLTYYSQLKENPNSIKCRTELIHYLWVLWRNDRYDNLTDMLQNELIYLIDHVQPKNRPEHMFQHLAMFLSAECYFMQGKLGNALKRLYQVLDCQEIYDNASEGDGFDLNGLAKFHNAVIGNILSIYMLAGLKDKAVEFKDCCEGIMDYSVTQLTSGEKIQGYFFLYTGYYSENLFKESYYRLSDGYPVYDIECLLASSSDISVSNSAGIYEGRLGKYPTLWFDEFGGIVNYPEVIERERETIRNI
ncbi:MAG: hypothetical protein IJ949_01300 [Oscillospiraceae bacterium]|nr:hypothetical protein [Oscillospiraceae bacterium]